MHEPLLELLHRLIVVLDLLWDCCKSPKGLWVLISDILEDMRCHLLAIGA